MEQYIKDSEKEWKEFEKMAAEVAKEAEAELAKEKSEDKPIGRKRHKSTLKQPSRVKDKTMMTGSDLERGKY